MFYLNPIDYLGSAEKTKIINGDIFMVKQTFIGSLNLNEINLNDRTITTNYGFL